MQIIPGIHQLRSIIPNSPLGHINAYVIQGNNGWLLVDTGWNSTKALNALEEQLGEIGIRFSDISQMVVTHIHPDHFGLASKIKELSGAKLLMHEKESVLARLRYDRTDETSSQMMRIGQQLKNNGMPEEEIMSLAGAFPWRSDSFPQPVQVDIPLEDGDTISVGNFNFQVIWTPGHSPGHVCLYERENKCILTGDHVLPTITPNIGLHPQSGDNPLGDFLTSLKKMAKLEVDLVLPAHEEVFQGLNWRIDELLAHHDQRLSEILNAATDEGKTAYQIASDIPWVIETGGYKEVTYADLTLFDKWLALGETLSHVELLRREEKLERLPSNGDDIVLYKAMVVQ